MTTQEIIQAEHGILDLTYLISHRDFLQQYRSLHEALRITSKRMQWKKKTLREKHGLAYLATTANDELIDWDNKKTEIVTQVKERYSPYSTIIIGTIDEFIKIGELLG